MVSLSNNTKGNVNITTKNGIGVNLTSNNDTDVNANMNGNAQRAKSWAVGEGLIDGVDYSAKHYAQDAKESAEQASGGVEAITEAKEQALSAIDEEKTEAIADMETAKSEKISEIENTAADFEDDLEALTTRAETAATNAETSETNAATSATSASTSATNASNSATSAATNANLALGYKNDAYTYANNAAQAKTTAETAASNAEFYWTQTYTAAGQASNSATSARQSASTAQQAKTTAENAASAAEGYAQQAEQAKDDIEAELDNYVPNTRKVNNKPLSTDITLTASDLGALANTTKYGYSVALSLDTTNYKLTLTLKDQDGTALSTKTVDFPIESVVVNGSYDSTNQKIVLTLQSGSTIDIPVGDLISGLQSEITSTNKLDSDLVDDTNSSHKFATAAQLSQIATNTSSISNLATVATSGSYNDLSNKPTIPDAQVQADWDVTDTTSKAYIKNKPYIPSGVVVDQTFDGTSTNAQSGVAIAGAGFLKNTATATNSLTILGTTNNQNNSILIGYGTTAGSTNSTVIGNTATSGGSYATALGYYARANAQYTTAIGNNSYASYQDVTAVGHSSQATAAGTLAVGSNSTASAQRATAIGYSSQATQYQATALGYEAKATANSALQIGTGTNSTANTLQVGSYTLLNTSTGLIPDARISSNIARTSQIPSITIDQTFDPTSANAQSGIAIAGAFDPIFKNFVVKNVENTHITNDGTQIDCGYEDENCSSDVFITGSNAELYYEDYNSGNNTSIQARAIGILLAYTSGNGNGVVISDNNDDVTLTVSNNNLAVNGSEVVTGNNTRFDGQWVMLSSVEVLLNGASLKNSSATPLPKTVTLPDDNHVYEVMIRGSVATGTATGNYVELMCTSTECSETVFVCSARTRSNSAVVGQGTVIIPMKHGTDNLSIIRDANYNGTANMAVIGYRRLGTNT